VDRFCSDRFPLEAVGSREGGPIDRTGWKELAGLGVLGLLLGEDRGGSGLGVVEGAIVFEQLGSHLAPGPLLWTVLASAFVDGAAGGDVLVGGLDARALEDGSAVVEHADVIDALVVVEDESIVVHRIADLGAPRPMDPLDPLTPVGRFTGVTGGTIVGDARAARDLDVVGTVLSAALLCGVASRALDVARAYALERHQFGVPIGSFQAIKHLLADMYVTSGLAQSAMYAAAAGVDESTGSDAARGASAAKLLAGEAAIANAGTAIQVLGGMGFTWDMLPNYLLKRAWVLEQGFGTADDHARRLGAELADNRR
jgi:alkylation response protein AidB-like acyl-CoA dehydrogenase